MDALPKENARRTVQLRHHHALGAVDHKRALGSHVGDGTQIHILYLGGKVLVIGVGAVELELGLEWHTVGEATVEAFIDSVARRVDEIVKKFKDKVIPRVRDGEILGKNFIESLVFSFLSWGI